MATESSDRHVVYPTVRRCRDAKRATEQELEGTAAHSAKEEESAGRRRERAERAILPNYL